MIRRSLVHSSRAVSMPKLFHRSFWDTKHGCPRRFPRNRLCKYFFHTVSVFANWTCALEKTFPGVLCVSWLQLLCQLSDVLLLSVHQHPEPPASCEPCLWLSFVVYCRTHGAGEKITLCFYHFSQRNNIPRG